MKIKLSILALLILCMLAHPCFAGVSAKKGVRKGNLLYNKGEFEEALKQYRDALLDKPDSDVVNFNMGAALYKIEDYRGAIGHFERSLVSEDQSLEQMASYNIGNAEYKYGIGKEESDLQGAVNLLRQSLHHYELALGLDSDDEDARYNYEFVKEELKRLEAKLEKQEQQEKQGQEEKREGEEEKAEAQQQQAEQQEVGAEEQQQAEQQATAAGKQQAGEGEEEKQAYQQAAESEEQTEEMLEEEAVMILEGYRQEEEPKGLYKEKMQTRGLPEVLKDW